MLVERRKVKMEWGDCDPQGIVFFPRYLAYFDASTAALFELAGLPKRRMFKEYNMAGYPLVDVHARFFIPSRFGDEVMIESHISRWGRSSFEVLHRLMRGAELAVEGVETRVWAVRDPDDPEQMKSAPVPQEIRDRFGRPD